MSFARLKPILAIVSLAALSACGGGSTSSSSTPAAQYPLDLAMSTFYQMPNTFSLKGSLGTDNYTLDLSLTPGSHAGFHGVLAMTALQSVNETKNGALFRSGSAVLYFLTTPFTQIGTNENNNLFELDSDQQPLPELTDAPSSGPLGKQTYYSDMALTTQVATGTRTWTLAALTSDTAEFCIHDTDDVGGPTETEIDCYELDIKGNVTALKITFESGGQTIVFQ